MTANNNAVDRKSVSQATTKHTNALGLTSRATTLLEPGAYYPPSVYMVATPPFITTWRIVTSLALPLVLSSLLCGNEIFFDDFDGGQRFSENVRGGWSELASRRPFFQRLDGVGHPGNTFSGNLDAA